MSLRTGASAGLGEREDPRLKRRRLVGRSKTKKDADKIKENNAQALAHNMGESRCECTGERCECSSQLRPIVEDQERKEYIPMSGQHVSHPYCVFNQFMCDPEGRWGEHFDMSLFPSNDQKFYAAIRNSGVWGTTRKGKRYYGRVSRPGETIEDPSEAMDGRTERPTDDRNVYFLDARYFRPENATERAILRARWLDKVSVNLLLNKTPEGVDNMLAAWQTFLADWIPRVKPKKPKKPKKKPVSKGAAQQPRRKRKLAVSRAGTAARAGGDGNSGGGEVASGAGSDAEAQELEESAEAVQGVEAVQGAVSDAAAQGAMSRLRVSRLNLSLLKFEPGNDTEAKAKFDKAVYTCLTQPRIHQIFAKIAADCTENSPSQYFAMRVCSAVDTCRRMLQYNPELRSSVASSADNSRSSSGVATAPSPPTRSPTTPRPRASTGSAAAATAVVEGFPEAAPDASRGTLTTEEQGNLEQLWLVVEKLQPDHKELMQQVTAKYLRRFSRIKGSAKRSTVRTISMVASFLKSKAYMPGTVGNEMAARMFDGMTFSQ